MTETYYKLAVWDERLQTFRDGKRAYASGKEAFADAKTTGRYRVSQVDGDGRRTDLEPFDVAGPAAQQGKPKRQAGGLRDRPGPWTRT